MPEIALLGAGRNMGLCLARNLKGSRLGIRHADVSKAGLTNRDKELGLGCVSGGGTLVRPMSSFSRSPIRRSARWLPREPYLQDLVFSGACEEAIEFGKPVTMKPDWKKVFEPERIDASIRRIT